MSDPIHVIRYGLIKCEIFVRRTPVGDRFNITISRLFRNGDAWSESKQFGRDDLPIVAKLADRAHAYLFEKYRAPGIKHEEPSA